MKATPIPDRVLKHVWSRVERRGIEECWPSTWSVASHGYGQIGWQDGRARYATTAHRAVWASVHGPIPDGMTVDHICHNRRCANPAHLRLLSNEENARDNRAGGHRPKLTEDAVRELRLLRETGITFAELALFFEVSRDCVRDACLGRSWKQVA